MKYFSNNKASDLVLDLLHDVSGSFIFAIGIICFVNPAKLAPGGMSGIAIMVNHIWGAPIGLMAFILNIPLFLLGYRSGGKLFDCVRLSP